MYEKGTYLNCVHIDERQEYKKREQTGFHIFERGGVEHQKNVLMQERKTGASVVLCTRPEKFGAKLLIGIKSVGKRKQIFLAASSCFWRLFWNFLLLLNAFIVINVAAVLKTCVYIMYILCQCFSLHVGCWLFIYRVVVVAVRAHFLNVQGFVIGVFDSVCREKAVSLKSSTFQGKHISSAII